MRGKGGFGKGLTNKNSKNAFEQWVKERGGGGVGGGIEEKEVVVVGGGGSKTIVR